MPRLSSKVLLSIASFAVLILFSFSLIPAQAQQPRLPQPRNLRVNGDTLSWDAVTNASGYRVRWRVPNRRAWRLAPVSPGMTSYRFTELAYDVDYTVEVRALAGAVEGYRESRWKRLPEKMRLAAPMATATDTASPTATATPSATATPIPTATKVRLATLPRPRGFDNTEGSTFVWNQLNGASAYEISWRQPGNRWRKKIIGKSQLYYTIDGLKPGVKYEVKLRGKADGSVFKRNGRWTGILTVTLEATTAAINTATDTPTNTPTDTPTNTPTDTPTNTPTDTPTNTPTDTPTNTPTDTPTNTPTDTPTNTPTDTPTNTPTDTPTNTPTDTPTNTPTDTPTYTPIPPTDTPTNTPTSTPPPNLPYPSNIRHSLFSVSWDAVDGAVEYGVRVRASVGDHPIRYVSGTRYDIPNPQYGASYYVYVQARGDGRTYAVDNEFSPRIYLFIQPTDTPVPPTDTPVPPTATPTSTNTPVPTDTPTATITPVASNTPKPTKKPTKKPEPTSCPKEKRGRHEWKFEHGTLNGVTGNVRWNRYCTDTFRICNGSETRIDTECGHWAAIDVTPSPTDVPPTRPPEYSHRNTATVYGGSESDARDGARRAAKAGLPSCGSDENIGEGYIDETTSQVSASTWTATTTAVRRCRPY